MQRTSILGICGPFVRGLYRPLLLLAVTGCGGMESSVSCPPMDVACAAQLDPTQDSDGDGVPDAVEVRLGSNPNQPDADADSDGDGLSNQREVMLGTDPGKRDTDDDGIADGDEVQGSTDPRKADSDGDGLSDGRERMLGIDPLKADTDGDGASDGQESTLGSDPLKTDTDGDTLSDGAEVQAGTDPTKPDTDGDGLSDAFELSYPKICVASTQAAQRPTAPPVRTGATPPPACSATADCLAGETCGGLDPKRADTDGDGVSDAQEDLNVDGQISFASGDTDPRLFDTDGDGSSDAGSGASICRPGAQLAVTSKKIGPIQLLLSATGGTVTDVAGTAVGRSAVTIDDNTSAVAALVASVPTKGADLNADRSAHDNSVASVMPGGLIPILVGVPFTTPEGLPGQRTTYRYETATATSASVLRDRTIMSLTGSNSPGGGGTAGAGNTAFTVEVTTVRRSAALDDLSVVIAPESAYRDASKGTALRVEDLAMQSTVSDATRMVENACLGAPAPKPPQLDLIWTVDVSSGMDSKQVTLAGGASALMSKLRGAGIDLRVGVFSAEGDPANAIDLTNKTFAGFPNGFEFIAGGATNPDRQLCRQLTSTVSGAAGFCPADGDKINDPISPFGINTTAAEEEPVAAAVRIHDLLKRNMSNGTVNPNWYFRANAVKAMFFVTDEPPDPMTPITNDFTRYFQNALNPDNAQRFAPGGTYNATALSNIVGYFKNNQVLTYGVVPVFYIRNCATQVDARDLPRCVIEGNGGLVSDILLNPATAIDTALDRMVSDVAGKTGSLTLARTPIISTLQVNVRGMVVPRSRSDGYDYDPRSKGIVFYGNTYRPATGEQIYVSYQAWKGTTG